MSSESEQEALAQIRRYIDAGHSIEAIRDAGWGTWFDYFESKSVSLDETQPDMVPPDARPPEAKQMRPAQELGTEAEAEQQATSSGKSADLLVGDETRTLLRELDQHKRSDFMAYTLVQRRPRLHRLFLTTSRRLYLSGSGHAQKIMSDEFGEHAKAIKKAGHENESVCRDAAHLAASYFPIVIEAESVEAAEEEARATLEVATQLSEPGQYEFQRACAAAGIAARATAEDIAALRTSLAPDLDTACRAAANAIRTIASAHLIDARASSKTGMAMAATSVTAAIGAAQEEHVKWLRKALKSTGQADDGPSILGRIASFFSFESKIAPEAQEALRTYLAAEWKLAAFQDVEAGKYNEVLTKYGGSATPGSPAFGEHIVPAAKRLRAAAGELVRRQRQLGPVHDESAQAYFAWQATYLAYENWVEAAVAAYEGLAEGETPHLQRVEDLFGEQQRAGDKAQKELIKLAGRLGMNAEEVRRTMQQAEDLGKEEARMWPH